MLIKQITDNDDFGRFIRFPETVYKGDVNWMPPFAGEMEYLLNRNNSFYCHAEAAYFLAVDGGNPVGRIACFVDRNHINQNNEQAGFFGFFECMPDFHIAEGLLDAAGAWLRERSIDAMRGPVNPSMNEECGFLLEGFDSPPTVRMPYSPPRYLDYMEDCGFTKVKDLYAYTSSLEDMASIGRLEQIASTVARKMPGTFVRPIDKNRLPSERALIKDIYSSAWSRQWEFVPRTDDEIDSLSEVLAPLIVPDLMLIVEMKGEAAGFLMALPDYNQVRIKVGDHRGFLGNLRLRRHARKVTGMRVMTLGIKERFRRRGLEALLYLEAFRAARRRGYSWAEMSLVPEDNRLMQRGCEFMGGKLSKKYRIFEKRILKQ